MGVRVRVCRHMEQKAEPMADARNAKVSRFGAMTYGQRDSRDVHYVGALIEVAFAAWKGGAIDEAVYAGGDNGVDVIIKVHGKTLKVAVKGRTEKTTRGDPWLLVEADGKEANADVTVLGVLDEPRRWVNFVGWATRGMVLRAPLVKTARDASYPLDHKLTIGALRRFREEWTEASWYHCDGGR